MSFWDSTKGEVVRFRPERSDLYPGWFWIDCGCCSGIMWGGEHPIECNRCHGSGRLCLHAKSGRIAEHPGGRFLGRVGEEDLNAENLDDE